MPTTTFLANKARDQLSIDFDYLAVGKLKTTTPTTNDKTLQHEVIRVASNLTDTSTDREVTKEFVIDSISANGFSLNEVSLVHTAVTQLEDGEDSSDWSASGDASVSTDSSIYEFGSKSLKMSLTYSTGQGTITKTTSIGDVSSFTVVSSGTPTGGVVRLDLYVDDVSNLNSTDAIKYRIGSDSSNYAEFTLQASSLSDATWYSWNIDLTSGTITGTPDWTSVAYQYVEVNCSASVNVYIDDVFIANEVGSRSSVPTIDKNNLIEAQYQITTVVDIE